MRFDPVKFMHLVDDMSFEEVGATTKLMLKLWQFGPMTDADVRRVCRSNFEVVRERMLEVEGALSFEMVEEARVYGQRAHSQKVEAGIASAAKRQQRSNETQRPFNDRSTGVLSKSVSDSYSESNSEKKERAKTDDGFEEFYKLYPNKKARGAAERAWAKMTKDERALCNPAIEAQVKANHFRGTDGMDYVPHPATWLNERRWMDEVKAPQPVLVHGSPRLMSKADALKIISELREKHGKDFQTHHIPADVYAAYRQQA